MHHVEVDPFESERRSAAARAEQRELGPLDELIPRVIVLAITELVAEEVRARRTARLTDLADQLALLAIRLLADDATGERVRALTRRAD
ncbi:MAG TPA: hypothetical protein VNZ05_05820 [Solirubrobacteraceae bacterium]|nr:hypothetical protein [Solirubrobacteraceae bacterium]